MRSISSESAVVDEAMGTLAKLPVINTIPFPARTRFITLSTALMIASSTTAVARQTGGTSDSRVENPQHQRGSGNGVPTANEQLKLLTSRLDLTSDQQSKIKPILIELHDATVKLLGDKSLTHEDRKAQVWDWRLKTDKRIREVLNEAQKAKLDQVEQEPHPELHGDVDARL
jgi:hypothetical protein